MDFGFVLWWGAMQCGGREWGWRRQDTTREVRVVVEQRAPPSFIRASYSRAPRFGTDFTKKILLSLYRIFQFGAAMATPFLSPRPPPCFQSHTSSWMHTRASIFRSLPAISIFWCWSLCLSILGKKRRFRNRFLCFSPITWNTMAWGGTRIAPNILHKGHGCS